MFGRYGQILDCLLVSRRNIGEGLAMLVWCLIVVVGAAEGLVLVLLYLVELHVVYHNGGCLIKHFR